MAPAATPEAWLLLDSEGPADGIAPGGRDSTDGATVSNRTAAAAAVAKAATSTFGEVEIWFERKGYTLIPHTSRMEKPDPYGQRPIRGFFEVICSHGHLLLLRLCSTDSHSPIELFVYSFPFWNHRDVATVEKLPVMHNISPFDSFGMLCRDKKNEEKCVVANLYMEFNQTTGRSQAFLDRWCRSSSLAWSSKPRKKVIGRNLPSSIERGQWRTDQVIPFMGTLLWVDFAEGIMWCSEPHNSGEFDYLELPVSPLPKNYERRPEKIMTVGYFGMT